MKVLLRANVPHLGQIGEVVQVKSGYARNYLMPRGLAAEPTTGNLKRIEAEKKAYLAELAKRKAGIQARAALVDGKEVTITALANEEGHLYGSVGPAQIVEALAREDLHVEEENIVLPEPIRTLDKYEVALSFGEGVTAKVNVWVVPAHREDQPPAEAGDTSQADEA
jgi:large subunit ribosomal protein L9